MREAVDAYGRDHDLSRNEVVVGALNARYGLGIKTTGYGHRPLDLSLSTPWSLHLPSRTRKLLRREAARRDATISGLIREAVALHLGLTGEGPKRRPRKIVA